MEQRRNAKVISSRGEEVDFDMLEIRQRVLNQATPQSTVQRRQYIDERRAVSKVKKHVPTEYTVIEAAVSEPVVKKPAK